MTLIKFLKIIKEELFVHDKYLMLYRLAAIKCSFFMESLFLFCRFQKTLRKRQKSKGILMNSWKCLSAVPVYFAGVEQREMVIKNPAENEIYRD